MRFFSPPESHSPRCNRYSYIEKIEYSFKTLKSLTMQYYSFRTISKPYEKQETYKITNNMK